MRLLHIKLHFFSFQFKMKPKKHFNTTRDFILQMLYFYIKMSHYKKSELCLPWRGALTSRDELSLSDEPIRSSNSLPCWHRPTDRGPLSPPSPSQVTAAFPRCSSPSTGLRGESACVCNHGCRRKTTGGNDSTTGGELKSQRRRRRRGASSPRSMSV